MKRARNFWVFVHGDTPDAARDAVVEIVEAHRNATTSRGGPDSGGYWWALFHELPHGTYTVRVRLQSGAVQTRQVQIADGLIQVRFDV